MAEQTQDNEENQLDKEDNRLPYEAPKLRKHKDGEGKVKNKSNFL